MTDFSVGLITSETVRSSDLITLEEKFLEKGVRNIEDWLSVSESCKY